LRHVRSILYALVLAPVLWVLTGVGFNHDLTTRGRGTFAVESYAGLLLLLLAGAAYGILVFAPISPAGPSLAGLAYLGIAVWALSAPDSYAGAFPASVTKDGFDLSRPGYGLAAMLAVPLIATALSGRRWAKYEPPVLPIIGVIGRARGAAAVAGTPVAVLETQVIGAPPGSARAGSEPTTVLRLPTAANENTTVLSRPSEQTTVAASRSDFAAEVAAQSPADEPSTAIVIPADQDVTEAVTSEETTVATPVVDEGDDRTQALRLPAEIDGDRTQALRLPVADDQDRTQALRLPSPAPAPAEPTGDTTQVIRPGLVQPPSDRTEVLKLPVADPAPSIAAQEQPDLTDDPTSRLIPPGGDRAAAENRSAVLNLERPPDEIADDTTRLDIPAQREPRD
jgi:hypothetical protein